MGKPLKRVEIIAPIEELENEMLVEIVRGKFSKDKKEKAYIILESRVCDKIFYIVRQFFIPGLSEEDIKQEALYALRFKAVTDFAYKIGRNGERYPFDKFAILCIRRHLSTVLKESFQNKKKTLNTSISLNQERGDDNGEGLFLIDIFPSPNSDTAERISDKEYYLFLFKKLMIELSNFEKQVFILYTKRYSYKEMNKLINRHYKNKNIKKRINIKSIDNSISRIKQKAQEIYDIQIRKEKGEI